MDFFLMDLIWDRHLEFCSPRLKNPESHHPTGSGGRSPGAAAHLFSCCLIRLHSVLLAASRGGGSLFARLVLCDGRPLCVASSHAGADESLCLECYSANANLHRSLGVPQHERHSPALSHLFRSAEEESVLAPWYQTINNIFLNDLKKVIFLPAASWPTLLRQKL